MDKNTIAGLNSIAQAVERHEGAYLGQQVYAQDLLKIIREPRLVRQLVEAIEAVGAIEVYETLAPLTIVDSHEEVCEFVPPSLLRYFEEQVNSVVEDYPVYTAQQVVDYLSTTEGALYDELTENTRRLVFVMAREAKVRSKL